jgi:hypothetical protein
MLQSFHRTGQVSTWVPDWLRPGRVNKNHTWVSSARTKEEPRMNKPFGVMVSDKSGNWDLWLVGASSHEEAVQFVSRYWTIRGRRVVAYDLTDHEEASKVCVFGSPNVTQHEYPHFLPVPAASGYREVPRRPGMFPTVGPFTNVQVPKPPKQPRKASAPKPATAETGKKRGRPPKKAVTVETPRGSDDKPGLAITSFQHREDPDSYRHGGPAPKPARRGRKA